jgi:hypothetical protein
VTVAALVSLALFDAVLSGVRAAAGRDGRIDKPPYYRAALPRALAVGVAVVAANAALAAGLVACAAEPAAVWANLLRAGARAVDVFGVFATVTLLALLFWFAPFRELRIVPTLVVLGPLTLVRPLVIAAGLLHAAIGASDWRVWLVAGCAGASMLGVEAIVGRAYRDGWRRLV